MAVWSIEEVVDIPVVIHMMGFLNVYYSALDMMHGRSEVVERSAAFERRTMRANRFFMGRTE